MFILRKKFFLRKYSSVLTQSVKKARICAPWAGVPKLYTVAYKKGIAGKIPIWIILLLQTKQQTEVNKMTHSDVWYAIDRFASEHKMSCSGLARRSGLDPTIFNKSKRWSKYGQPRWPSTGSIAKILAATGESVTNFTKYFNNKEM